MAGVADELSLLKAEGAWHFSQEGQRVCLMGANPAGQVMWRMTGDFPFDALRFEWHPTAFDEMYRRYLYGRFNIAAMLAVVLRLLPVGGLILHGSAQVVNGAGIICTGPSGKGKSTLSKLFARGGVSVLTDEHPIVRPCVQAKDGGAFDVYGSPWPSSGGFALNQSAPLKKIYFLEHGSQNALEPLSTRDAVLRLLDVSLVPWMDAAFFDPLLKTLEALIGRVPHAVFRFRPDETAVDFIRRDVCAANAQGGVLGA